MESQTLDAKNHDANADSSSVRVTDIRQLERESIRSFVESCAEHFTGRVLDLGCGKQPYRDVVEQAGGTYVGFDSPTFPGSTVDVDTTGEGWDERFDTVLCNQVVQYVPDVPEFLFKIHVDQLRAGGVLVLTYPLCWDWIEAADLHRFSPTGMARMLTSQGFVVERSEERAAVELAGFRFPLGYGVVARAL